MSEYKVGKKIKSVQDFQDHLDKGDDSFYILNHAKRYQRFPKEFFYKEKFGTLRNQIKLGMIFEALPAESVDMEPLFKDDINMSLHTCLMIYANSGDLVQIYENDELIVGIIIDKETDSYEDILSNTILAKTVRDIVYEVALNGPSDDNQCIRMDLIDE